MIMSLFNVIIRPYALLYALGVTSKKKKSLFKDIIQIKVDHPPSYPIFDKLFFDKF